MLKLYEHQEKPLKRRSLVGYEGLYEIDEDGNIYGIVHNSSRRIGVKKPYVNRGGYLRINLYDANGKAQKHYIHRLVAQTFIPNPKHKKEVNHKDGNKLNNNVNNLEWCTRSENQRHAFATGLEFSRRKLTEVQVKDILNEYVFNSKEHGTVALAKKYGVAQCTIHKIVKGGGY